MTSTTTQGKRSGVDATLAVAARRIFSFHAPGRMRCGSNKVIGFRDGLLQAERPDRSCLHLDRAGYKSAARLFKVEVSDQVITVVALWPCDFEAVPGQGRDEVVAADTP